MKQLLNIILIVSLSAPALLAPIPAFADSAASSVLASVITPLQENFLTEPQTVGQQLPDTAATGTQPTLSQPPVQQADFGPSLTLTFQQDKFYVSPQTISSWQSRQVLTPDKIFTPAPVPLDDALLSYAGLPMENQTPAKAVNYDPSAIYSYIKTIAAQIDAPAEEPNFQIINGRVTAFAPGQTGLETDLYQSTLSALTALENEATSSGLSIVEQDPKTLLEDTNNLGINQLIGEGVSSFKGSPDNRRHNIAAGITKFQGLIITPGQTFSFDDSLGPVTADAGFLPELVIDNGNTLPELGGGLCQVSTTTFRAAMAAGLPITARRNHAYAVSYYSPQGTDATIYPGSADLKFVNDTPGSILIWPYEKDSNTLVFDFYGTSDGRQVTLEKPVVYDRQADGSMKATWTRLVTKNGVTQTDVFKSVYQSPALFHKTETFVTADGEQTSGLKMPLTTDQKTVQ